MSVQLSSVITPTLRGPGRGFSVKAIDLFELGHRVSPVVVLDDFRVSSRPFSPHPHAGFSAVTYVFRDSPGSLRSRDSLGHDIEVAPGGIVWTQAGSGMLHHEIPAQAHRELHGAQLFVNLSAKNKFVAPQLLWLDADKIPEWRSDAGDLVRVIVGSFAGVSSPLEPAEPLTFLDVDLQRSISIDLIEDHFAIVYILAGDVLVKTDERHTILAHEQAVTLRGTGGSVTFEARHSAQFLYLAGAEINDPALADGPFIMNEPEQIREAVKRYQSGEMGSLAPLADE